MKEDSMIGSTSHEFGGTDSSLRDLGIEGAVYKLYETRLEVPTPRTFEDLSRDSPSTALALVMAAARGLSDTHSFGEDRRNAQIEATVHTLQVFGHSALYDERFLGHTA